MDARRLPGLDVSIYERIGRGNQGKVFRGVHDTTGEILAVKLVDSREQHGAAAITDVEIAALKRLKGHSGILALKSPPTATKRPCKRRREEVHHCIAIATEYAPHGTLREQVVLGGLPESVARVYFAQLIAALQHASLHGIAHRDVKPANILLAGDWSLRLADFGLASLAAASGTAMQTQCGTRRYMAPEVLLGLPYSGEAIDVWSAGVVLFMLLTGGPPWDDASDRDWYFVASPSPRFWEAHERFYSFSPSAKALITAMLAKKPAERCSLAACAAHPWLASGPAMSQAELATYMATHNGLAAPAPVLSASAAAAAAPVAAAACGGSGGPATSAATGAPSSAATDAAAVASESAAPGALRSSTAASAMSSSAPASDGQTVANAVGAGVAVASGAGAAGGSAVVPAAAAAAAVARTKSGSARVGEALAATAAADATAGGADAFARRATRSSVPAAAGAAAAALAASGGVSPAIQTAPPTVAGAADLGPPPPSWRPGSALLSQLPPHLPRGHVAVSALAGTCSMAFEDALQRAAGAGPLLLHAAHPEQLRRPNCVLVRAANNRTAITAVASFLEHVLTASILKVSTAPVAVPAGAGLAMPSSSSSSLSIAGSPVLLTARIEVPALPQSPARAGAATVGAGAAAVGGASAPSTSLVVDVDFAFMAGPADALSSAGLGASAGGTGAGETDSDVAVLCQRRSGDDGAFVQVVAALRAVLGLRSPAPHA